MDALTYRTSDARWGAGEGGNLTPKKVDENFFAIFEKITDLEMYPLQPLEIDSISVSGNQMTFHMSDGLTDFGPFTIPTAAFTWAGNWLPATAYPAYALVIARDNLYLVLEAHTSAGTFTVTSEYQLLMPLPSVFDVGLFFPQKPGYGIPAEAPMMSYLAIRSFYIEATAPLTLARLRVGPAAELVFRIHKNTTEIGTVTFAVGETSGVVDFDTETAFEAGDFLRVLSPEEVDTTAIDLNITFAGRLGEP